MSTSNNLLIIEDRKNTAKMMKLTLERIFPQAGAIEIALSAPEAVAKMETQKYGAAISDGLNGAWKEVYKKGTEKNPKMYFLLVSGDWQERESAEGLNIPTLDKPVSIEQLEGAITKYLGMRK